MLVERRSRRGGLALRRLGRQLQQPLRIVEQLVVDRVLGGNRRLKGFVGRRTGGAKVTDANRHPLNGVARVTE